MTYHVEPARNEDLDAIEALLPRLAAFEVPAQRQPDDLWHGDRELVRAWGAGERPDVSVRVIRDAHGLLGVSVVSSREELLTHAPSVHLEILAVAVQAEGRGVGAALLAAVETEARATGAAMISLHVFTNNQHARHVYARHGFTEEILRCVKPLD